MSYYYFQKTKISREYTFEGEWGIKIGYVDATLDKKKPDIVFPEKGVTENIEIQALVSLTEELTYIAEAKRVSDEIYKMLISEKDGKIKVQIHCAGNKGFLYALFAVRRMAENKCFLIGEILDYPLFEVRGYIEGFYGTPWKAEQRPEMMYLLAKYGENTHYYAPKDDLYHRKMWRELYPQEDLLHLKKLVDVSKDLCMDFCYCIAPGYSIKYSSEEDFNALCEKTRQLYSIGITSFGLLLDDIPPSLYYEEDKALYTETVNAHIYLCKHYYAFLKTLGAELTVCPMEYFGDGQGYYISRLGREIDAEISLFYTGEDICSKRIRTSDAVDFERATLKQPLYWDNFPVNDAEMFKEMHISPIIGRDRDLFKSCKGIISNCMEYFNCNKIPLLTVAMYLWNPDKYDPESAFNEAVETIIPEDEKNDFILLSEHFRTSCLKDENSYIMNGVFYDARMCFETGAFEDGIRIVADYTAKVHLAASRLAVKRGGIYGELREWIDKFILMSEILDKALLLISGNSQSDEIKEDIREKMRIYNNNATVLTAFSFREYVEWILEQTD